MNAEVVGEKPTPSRPTICARAAPSPTAPSPNERLLGIIVEMFSGRNQQDPVAKKAIANSKPRRSIIPAPRGRQGHHASRDSIASCRHGSDEKWQLMPPATRRGPRDGLPHKLVRPARKGIRTRLPVLRADVLARASDGSSDR